MYDDRRRAGKDFIVWRVANGQGVGRKFHTERVADHETAMAAVCARLGDVPQKLAGRERIYRAERDHDRGWTGGEESLHLAWNAPVRPSKRAGPCKAFGAEAYRAWQETSGGKETRSLLKLSLTYAREYDRQLQYLRL